MAKEEQEEHLEEDAPKKGKKGLVIIIAAVLLLGGGGAGLFFSGMLDDLIGKEKEVADAKDKDASDDEAHADGKDAKDKKKKEATPVAFFELPEVIANLQSPNGGPSYIKAKITIEAPSEEIRAELEKSQPVIMDAINTYVRELRPNDLKGSAGTFRLQEELSLRVNKAIYPNEINKILIEQLLIQ
jgi:flagellar protein FliL